MTNSNFEKIIKSIQNFYNDLLNKKSDVDHDHESYIKKSEIATVALTGSYLDLTNKPTDSINGATDEEVKSEINSILGGNYYY